MAWYWIVLIVVSYIVLAGILGGLMDAMFDSSDFWACGIVWPLSFPIALIIYVIQKISGWVEDLFIK